MGSERFSGGNVFGSVKGFYSSPANVHRENFPVAGIYREEMEKCEEVL